MKDRASIGVTPKNRTAPRHFPLEERRLSLGPVFWLIIQISPPSAFRSLYIPVAPLYPKLLLQIIEDHPELETVIVAVLHAEVLSQLEPSIIVEVTVFNRYEDTLEVYFRRLGHCSSCTILNSVCSYAIRQDQTDEQLQHQRETHKPQIPRPALELFPWFSCTFIPQLWFLTSRVQVPASCPRPSYPYIDSEDPDFTDVTSRCQIQKRKRTEQDDDDPLTKRYKTIDNIQPPTAAAKKKASKKTREESQLASRPKPKKVSQYLTARRPSSVKRTTRS
ncbi:hypothetical protein K439DRAFT_1560441 [Ramaria rubella]|nr:hypothetical protein K439DRAFT_1560441 [Ramaria rubella]